MCGQNPLTSNNWPCKAERDFFPRNPSVRGDIVFLLFENGCWRASSGGSGAPLALAAQTRGDSRTKLAGGQIKGLSAAWTRSWQLFDSTLWSCWLVMELFSRLLKEAKVEQGERARGSSTHVRLSSGLVHTSTLDTVAGSTPRLTTT